MHIWKRRFGFVCHRTVYHLAVITCNPLLWVCSIRSKNQIKQIFTAVAALACNLCITDQSHGFFPTHLIIYKLTYNFNHIFYGLRCRKSQRIHPVFPQPHKVRSVRNIRFGQCHNFTVKCHAVYQVFAVAGIHFTYSVTDTVLIRYRQVFYHIIFDKRFQVLILAHKHNIRQFIHCNRHAHVGIILLIGFFKNIPVLDINHFLNIPRIRIVFIRIPRRHIGIIRAYHLSQCIHNRFGIRAKRRRYRSLHLLCIFLPRGQNTISRAVTPG